MTTNEIGRMVRRKIRIRNTPIECLGLTDECLMKSPPGLAILNILKASGIHTVGDLSDFINDEGLGALHMIKGIGEKRANEISRTLLHCNCIEIGGEQ